MSGNGRRQRVGTTVACVYLHPDGDVSISLGDLLRGATLAEQACARNDQHEAAQALRDYRDWMALVALQAQLAEAAGPQG